MTDLVRQARELGGFSPEAELCSLMADEIERLRKALRPFAVAANALDRDGWDEGSIEGSLANVTAKHCRVARAALGEKE